MKEQLRERLRKKQLIIRLIGFLMVAAAVITLFLPIYEVKETVEAYGIEETISAKFSVLQIMTQNKKIELNSSSALGEFSGFSSLSMVDILGGSSVAWIVTASLIGLAIFVVLHGISVLFAALLNVLRREVIKNFMLSFFIFMLYPIFILTITEQNTGYIESIPIVFIIVFAAITFTIMSVTDKLFKDISVISTEIFLMKYKREDKKWYDAFITDVIGFIDDSNLPLEIESRIRFLDAHDRNDLREKQKNMVADKAENENE